MNIAPSSNFPWRIAHRGYHARCVENTLAAFAAAYDCGCDLVEFDVQLSADGVPVIFHDDDLVRLGRRAEAVSAVPIRDLKRLELRDPITGAMGRIPDLAEFLAAFGSKPFYLEIKVPAAKIRYAQYWRALTAKVIAALRSGSTHPKTFVASFHLGAVRHALDDLDFARAAVIHARLPSLRAVLQARPDDGLTHRLFDSLPYALFQKAKKIGLILPPARVLLWNVVGASALRDAGASGVAGVVADDVPEMLRMVPARLQNKA